jgi:superfamily I DNA/RNA helicase
MVTKVFADLPERSRPAFVGTFHLLGYTWGVTPPSDAGSDFWERDAVSLTLAAGEALGNEQRFTAFVVDEAQDFADSWWPALLSSAASPDFRLAVFRDDEQAVFSERRGRPDLPLVPLVLDDNLRNSRQIVETFRPLVDAEITAKGGSAFPVEFIDCAADDVIAAADDVIADLLENRGWLPEHVALLTTQHRHPVHVELGEDKAAYWKELWATDEVFYSTVAGFKGLERPVVVLAVDGFHSTANPRSVMYTGMSRARDLLIIVGPSGQLAEILDAKTMRRLRR